MAKIFHLNREGIYPDGRAYAPARGRRAPRARIDDAAELSLAVVDLQQEHPDARVFVDRIVREMKIRFYSPKSMRAYASALRSFLGWYGRPPHDVTREIVRQYLECLVDGGASSSWVASNLSAIRMGFDKLCGESVTLGLMTPRRPKRLPVVLSPQEIVRLLEAAPSLRDKLVLGLMYATGMRISEAVRLRWRDIDFDRRTVSVWRGKGNKDRLVMLPKSFTPMLGQLGATAKPDGFVFSSTTSRRHLSPATVQRVMARAVHIAGIRKHVTPHCLRHSFATHLLESGTDIRFIQKLLGHVRLETTRIYVHVATRKQEQVSSPIDRLLGAENSALDPGPRHGPRPVGRLHMDVWRCGSGKARASLTVAGNTGPVVLGGIAIREARPGWVSIDLPPLEAWAASLGQLSPEQRQRLAEPRFYAMLQKVLTQRYFALK